MVNPQRVVIAFFAALFCGLIILLEEVGESLGIEWVEDWLEGDFLESALVVLLVLAIVVLGIETMRLRKSHKSMEDKVAVASSAFDDLLQAHFEEWQLSQAEQQITRLMLKGCSIAEIAEIRSSAEGTIKSQTNSIYKKSGYGSKTQLLSVFLEELTGGKSLS